MNLIQNIKAKYIGVNNCKPNQESYIRKWIDKREIQDWLFHIFNPFKKYMPRISYRIINGLCHMPLPEGPMPRTQTSLLVRVDKSVQMKKCRIYHQNVTRLKS